VSLLLLASMNLPLTAKGVESPARVTVDGRILPLDVPPMFVDARLLVPLRAIFEALGASIEWDGATRTVTAAKDHLTVVLTVGKPTAIVGGQEVALAVPARIVDGRTMVPLRFVAEALGAKVDWENSTRTAIILAKPAAGDSSNQEIGPTVAAVNVRTVSAGALVQKPGNYFDLENKTLRFTPADGGGYTLQALALQWQEGGSAIEGTAVSLPFAFPFGEKTWEQVHVNPTGTISFGQSESAAWGRHPGWADATMHSMGSMISGQAAVGAVRMIAALWGLNDEGKGRITTQVDASGLLATWETVRRNARDSGPAQPAGTNLFQAFLRPDGSIDLSYKKVPERDGIVGLFPGSAVGGTTLDSADDPVDSALSEVDVRNLTVRAAGANVKFTFTMAANLPTEVSTGRLMHRVFLEYGEQKCEVWSFIADAVTASSQCGFTPAVRLDGNVLEFIVPRDDLSADGSFGWHADVVWDERPGLFDQVSVGAYRRVTLSPDRLDISRASGRLFGNSYEVFHFPVMSKNHAGVSRQIYSQHPADDDLAIVLLDFRVDSIYAAGTGSGRINVPIQGIGSPYTWSTSTSPRAEAFGSAKLQASALPQYLWALPFAETYSDGTYTTRKFGRFIDWAAHELVHSWAASLKFLNPLTGKIEPLYADEPCKCHWDPGLHLPSYYSVISEYSTGYAESSPMGTNQGNYWMENDLGAFTKQSKPYHFPSGLSALDLYVMGLLPPEEVPDTFIVRPDAQGRMQKVPVRIGDIIAAMGPRRPTYAESQKEFTLNFYLMSEDGRQPSAEDLKQVQKMRDQLARHFSLISGGRMKIKP
jgi:hypothetical protein